MNSVRCRIKSISQIVLKFKRPLTSNTTWKSPLSMASALNANAIHQRNENMMKPQEFDYFVVLDFEATCEKDTKPIPQEIIEFPMLIVSGSTFKIESIFHKYVEPDVHKELTPFCTELTGIVQDMVDGQPHFKQVLQDANSFLLEEGLLEPECKFTFVTCGDWDLKTMLPSQASYFNVKYPKYFNRWINIKRSYSEVMGTFPKGMMSMLAGLDIKHKGRHHSGIDDCHNIAAILEALASKGYVYRITGSL